MTCSGLQNVCSTPCEYLVLIGTNNRLAESLTNTWLYWCIRLTLKLAKIRKHAQEHVVDTRLP